MLQNDFAAASRTYLHRLLGRWRSPFQ